MRDVVIIGGGLSGLAAVNELQQHGLDCTLIEVKNRLGGSIQSVRAGGFIFDTGVMCHTLTDPAWFMDYLSQIGLRDTTILLEDQIAFKHGTGSLVDALADNLSMPVMYRMAVSTVGQMDDGRYSICMENGMVLDASALLIAAPARYAERILYPLVPEISLQLLDYEYETITRVSLGYADGEPPHTAADDRVVSLDCLTHPARGGTIIQAGLRFSADDLVADGKLTAVLGLPARADASYIATWRESDPVMWRDPQHPAVIHQIMKQLPPGVALVGSDYIPTHAPPHLDERIRQGIEGARRLIG